MSDDCSTTCTSPYFCLDRNRCRKVDRALAAAGGDVDFFDVLVDEFGPEVASRIDDLACLSNPAMRVKVERWLIQTGIARETQHRLYRRSYRWGGDVEEWVGKPTTNVRRGSTNDDPDSNLFIDFQPLFTISGGIPVDLPRRKRA